MIQKPTFVKKTLTPTWYYPLYRQLQQRRPLPLSKEEEEQATSESETACDSDENSDSASYTFLPITGTESAAASARSARSTKKKRKKTRETRNKEDSDQEPSRKPLSQSIHKNRQVQRLNSHPNMAKTRSGNRRVPSENDKSNDKQDDTDSTGDADMEKENAELKMKLARMKKRLKMDRTGASSDAFAHGTSKAMAREVAKLSKTKLWKVCKFFKNDAKVRFCFECFGSCFDVANHFFYTFCY